LDFQRVNDWAAANGFKLNPIKSQVILISRCRVAIPSPSLLIGLTTIFGLFKNRQKIEVKVIK
jgi:hypothetical protein